jgi:hypothetical protein
LPTPGVGISELRRCAERRLITQKQGEIKMSELTSAEQQLIETIRTLQTRGREESRPLMTTFRNAGAKTHFRLEIEFVYGAWDVRTLSEVSEGKIIGGRGVGATFDEAWHSINPDWA